MPRPHAIQAAIPRAAIGDDGCRRAPGHAGLSGDPCASVAATGEMLRWCARTVQLAIPAD